MTPAQPIPARDIRQALKGRTILVVEDEFLIAMEIEITLEEVGAAPILANSVEEAARALDAAGDARPDAAVLDVRLPDGDSLGIAARLRAAGVPFLFQSGHTVFDDLPPELEAPVLTKPVAPQRVLSELTILLGVGQAGN